MNAVMILGGLVALPGLLLFVTMALRTLSALVKKWRFAAHNRRPKDMGVYAEAVAAPNVYVPWTVTKRLALTLLALVIVALGGALAFGGHLLARDYVHLVPDPSLVGTLDVRPDGPTAIGIRYEEAAGTRSCSPMPGSFAVIRGEFIQFDERLESLGLTTYQRVIGIESFQQTADVLINKGQSMCEVHGSGRLWPTLEWLEKNTSFVATQRNMTPPLRVGTHEVSAGRGGYLVSFRGE